MRRLILIFLISVLGFSLQTYAQSYQKNDSGVEVKTGTLLLKIQFYSPGIVRVVKSLIGSTYHKESLSVIKKPEKVAFSVARQGS